MRRKTCNYSLWNLSARNCPECGDAFAPSDYEFKPNAVEFRCPHCAQPYFGTSPEGHLAPRAFECVQCHTPVEMDEMVLVPAPGVDPDSAILDHHPWINRTNTGKRRGWWKASVLGMFNPFKLARLTPEDAGLGAAWKFTLLNLSIFVVVYYALIVALGALGALLAATGSQGGGPQPGTLMLMVLGVYGVMFLIAYVLQIIFVALWIPITHVFLKLTGGTQHTMRATSLSILYTSGAFLPNIVPCVNYVSWLWWPISAGLMLREMQGVSTWRAVIATLTAPILAVVGVIGAYAAFVAWMIALSNTAMNAAANTANSMQQGRAVWDGLNDHTMSTGSYPAHALLAIATGDLEVNDVIHPETRTVLADVPLGDETLDSFEFLTPEEQLQLATNAAGALPDDVVAHRLGDVVFTHHGFSPGAHFNLWIAIISPDPDANPGQTDIGGTSWVCLVSGSFDEYPAADFDAALELQNELRAEHSLAPLPHPSDVTHTTPASAKP